jgi:hypothetical protein
MENLVAIHKIILKVMAYPLVPQRVTETAKGHECFGLKWTTKSTDIWHQAWTLPHMGYFKMFIIIIKILTL